jgi:fumarylacetoacetase
VAHMTVNGASSRTGDLYGSGISGPAKEQRGAFLELTWVGKEPITVKGEERSFLLDSDEAVITGTPPGVGGGRIGFGDVRGRVLPDR